MGVNTPGITPTTTDYILWSGGSHHTIRFQVLLLTPFVMITTSLPSSREIWSVGLQDQPPSHGLLDGRQLEIPRLSFSMDFLLFPFNSTFSLKMFNMASVLMDKIGRSDDCHLPMFSRCFLISSALCGSLNVM